MPARIQVLARLPLFANLTERELSDIIPLLEDAKAARGTVLIAEGAPPGTPLHVLWSGSVSTVKRGEDGRSHPVATLRAPALFGEMDLLAERPALVSVVAMEPVRYASLSASAVFTLVDAARPSILKVLNNLASTLRYRTVVTESRLKSATTDRGPPKLGAVRELLYSGWDRRF